MAEGWLDLCIDETCLRGDVLMNLTDAIRCKAEGLKFLNMPDVASKSASIQMVCVCVGVFVWVVWVLCGDASMSTGLHRSTDVLSPVHHHFHVYF